MTTIWERTYAALAPLAMSMANNEFIPSGSSLPDQFLVYSLVSAPPEQHADNRETMRSYRMQVTLHSKTGFVVAPQIDAAMVAADFCRGPMTELPFSQLTGHYRLALEYTYSEGV